MIIDDSAAGFYCNKSLLRWNTQHDIIIIVEKLCESLFRLYLCNSHFWLFFGSICFF